MAPISIDSAVAYYRSRLAKYLGEPLKDGEWQPMWELGVLVNNLRISCLRAWLATFAEDEDFRSIYRELLTPVNEQVRAAVKWL